MSRQSTLGTVAARRRAQRDADAPTGGRKRYGSDDKGNRWMVTLNLGHDQLEALTAEKKIWMRKYNAAAQVPPCTYAVFQVETGEEGGNLHLQGYFEFNKRMTRAQVVTHCGGHVWCELAKGNQEQCIAYCTKEETRLADTESKSYGEPMKLNSRGGTSGSRTDWADIIRLVKDGATDMAVIDAHPAAAPHTKAIGAIRFAYQQDQHRTDATELIVLYGEPGTGKTRTAIGLCEPGTYFLVNSDGKSLWWDGYDPSQHATIIFDEFTGSRCPLTFLNQLADRYDVNVQTKGSYVRFLAKRIIITSNFAPAEWYSGVVQSKFEALERRITTSLHFVFVQQILDMSHPDRTGKKLHIEVMKGKFNFRCIRSNEGLDHCCHALLGDEQFAPVLDDSMDSSDEIAAIQRINTQDWSNGDSQLDPIDVSDDDIDLNANEELEDSFDLDDTPFRKRDSQPTAKPAARASLGESGWISSKGKARRLEPVDE